MYNPKDNFKILIYFKQLELIIYQFYENFGFFFIFFVKKKEIALTN